MSSEISALPSSRRLFLKRTTGALAMAGAAKSIVTPIYGQNQAPSANVAGSNEKIVCGYVGVGGQGAGAHVGQDVAHFKENNTSFGAVCDVSKHRIAAAQKQIADGGGGSPKGYEDYRKLLEDKDIDAIFCATVDHWHTPVSCDAMEAGKHVYVEKPMTRYLDEAFRIADTAKKTGKLLQVGSQGCSDSKWHKAAEWIKAGKIGPIVMLQGSYMRNNPWGEWNYTIQPWAKSDDINWDLWMGNQVKRSRPFTADHYFRWRKYYPYCSGLLGDLFPHKLHPYMLATGNPEFPARVSAVGSKAFKTDLYKEGRKPEQETEFIRDVPEIIQLIAEFPSGYVMHITSSTVNEQGTQEMIRGHKATLTMAGNKVELRPERSFAEEIDPQTSEAFPAESVAAHHANFFAAIRGQQKLNAGIDLALKVQTVISLAEASDRIGVVCFFDEKTRKVTDGQGREIRMPTYGWHELS
ncbi:MAG TPA: Gfo/Idh/MocA family oxidoreductase [Verrucomicrobiota bacterium]|nr:oxidoreductase [Verrucomicrobiales bacterium]HRI12013.1 Gfo/Idh/MocA family oxidoreductase [Verrucomicrobiota bacterium]